MRFLHTIVLTAALLLAGLMPELARSQTDNLARSGSFYSGFGFGSPIDVNSPYAGGMGLQGVSSFTNMSPGIANPAQWGLIGYTQGNVRLALDNYRARDNSSSANFTLLSFNNFQMVIPVLRNKLGISASFTPLTRSDFEVFNEGSFEPVDGVGLDPVEYITNVAGSGGVNRFEIGAGVRVTEFLSAGYAFSANLLAQEQESTTGFSDLRYSSILTTREVNGFGYGHRFGLFMYKEDIFNAEDQISIGASISLPVDIEAERTISTFRNVDNERTLIELNEGSADREGLATLPLEFNAGLTYNLNRFVSVSAEMLVQDWDNAQYSYSPDQETYFKKRVKSGFGVQYHPYRAEQFGGFMSGFKYSLGTTYDTGHLSINGNDIETFLINAGIGLISRRSPSSVDLNFHYGIRGTLSSDLVKENIWGITLSLNLAEFMFVRQRFQ